MVCGSGIANLLLRNRTLPPDWVVHSPEEGQQLLQSILVYEPEDEAKRLCAEGCLQLTGNG